MTTDVFLQVSVSQAACKNPSFQSNQLSPRVLSPCQSPNQVEPAAPLINSSDMLSGMTNGMSLTKAKQAPCTKFSSITCTTVINETDTVKKHDLPSRIERRICHLLSRQKRMAMVCSKLLETGPRKTSKQLSYQVTFGKQTQQKKVTAHQISKEHMFQERLTCKSQILTSPSRHPEAMRPGMVGWKVTHQGVRRCPTKEWTHLPVFTSVM